MGTSKLMGERLMTAANVVNHNAQQRFSSVRFGNVIGSRGSVLPIFHEQIRKGGPLTVTHSDMTRFIMSLEHGGPTGIGRGSVGPGWRSVGDQNEGRRHH
jgi:FlaA1/EpsC-like NDP-sugar epimerase